MLSKTHNLVESMTYALGPLFHEEPDYTTIQQAIGLVIARIAMATPNRGKEFLELSIIHEYSQKALEELLNIEKEQAAKKNLVEQGISRFTELIAEGGNPGEFGYKVVDGVESPAGRTFEEIQAEEAQEKVPYSENELEWPQYNEGSWSPDQEEAEQARLDTYKED